MLQDEIPKGENGNSIGTLQKNIRALGSLWELHKP